MDKCKNKEDMVYDLADLFKMFGDSTRLNIMMSLSKVEMCVGDLTESLGMTQSAVSHQLTILRGMKLVKSRREGKNMYYSLADSHVEDILRIGIEHICE